MDSVDGIDGIDGIDGLNSGSRGEIAGLTALVREFAAERGWQEYHSPKNLVMALSVEAGELVEIFQWLTPAEAEAVMSDPAQGEHVREEVADVLAYLLGLCDRLGVDPAVALREKMVKNAVKYPAPDRTDRGGR